MRGAGLCYKDESDKVNGSTCPHAAPRWEMKDRFGRWIRADMAKLRQGFTRGDITGSIVMRYCLGWGNRKDRILVWFHENGQECNANETPRVVDFGGHEAYVCGHGNLVRMRERDWQAPDPQFYGTRICRSCGDSYTNPTFKNCPKCGRYMKESP